MHGVVTNSITEDQLISTRYHMHVCISHSSNSKMAWAYYYYNQEYIIKREGECMSYSLYPYPCITAAQHDLLLLVVYDCVKWLGTRLPFHRGIVSRILSLPLYYNIQTIIIIMVLTAMIMHA